MDVIWFILIGLLAGFMAGLIMHGKGFGFLANLLTGVLGGVLGGLMLDWLGIAAKSFVGNLICATIGALVLLFILSLLKKK